MRGDWVRRLRRLLTPFGTSPRLHDEQLDPGTKWIERRLVEIANIAWARTGPPSSSGFLLGPETLPEPNSTQNCSKILNALYDHARHWASGFEIPYRIPTVRFSGEVTSAGQFRVDSDGYTFVELPFGTFSSSTARLAVLCHEA